MCVIRHMLPSVLQVKLKGGRVHVSPSLRCSIVSHEEYLIRVHSEDDVIVVIERESEINSQL